MQCALCLSAAAHPDVVEVVDSAKVDVDAEEDGVEEEQKEELVVVVANAVVHPGRERGAEVDSSVVDAGDTRQH